MNQRQWTDGVNTAMEFETNDEVMQGLRLGFELGLGLGFRPELELRLKK